MTSQDIINKLIEYGVPQHDAQILAACGYAESGYQAGILGDGGDSIGLFQINTPAHGKKLESWTGSTILAEWVEWLKNPDNNIFAAAQVYFSQGLGAWTMFKNGGYMPYVGDTGLTVTGGTGTSSVPSPSATGAGTYWRPAEVPDDAPDPSQPYWKRVLYFNKLILTGKIKEAQAYKGTWTDSGTAESKVAQQATDTVTAGNTWILPLVKQGFKIVVALVLVGVGVILLSKTDTDTDKEGIS